MICWRGPRRRTARCVDMTAYQRQVLGKLADLADPGSHAYVVTDAGRRREIFVVRRADQVYGYVNACPHTGAPLDWMPHQFLNQAGDLIQCANHAALFRMADGYCVWGPCAGSTLHAVTIEVADEALVYVAPTTAAPGPRP